MNYCRTMYNELNDNIGRFHNRTQVVLYLSITNTKVISWHISPRIRICSDKGNYEL